MYITRRLSSITEYNNSHVNGLKSSYDDVISAVDDFFDQWDPSSATQLEEVYRLHRGLCQSAFELFS